MPGVGEEDWIKPAPLTHLLDTADPSTWPIGLGMNALSIMTGREASGRLEADVVEHLRRDPGREAVEWLEMRAGAAWGSLDVVRVLPRLREVAVYASDVVDLTALRDVPGLQRLTLRQDRRAAGTLDVLAETSVADLTLDVRSAAEQHAVMACPRLRRLSAGKWRDADASGMASETLEELVLVAGRLRSFAGMRCPRLRAVHCVRIRTLEDVAGLPAETLVIEGCRGVRYESLAGCPRLRHLRLSSQGPIDSLAFLAGCAALERVVVSAGKVADDVTETFTPGEKLRTVHLARARDEVVAELSRRFTAVRFSNRHGAWEQGDRSPLADDDWAVFV